MGSVYVHSKGKRKCLIVVRGPSAGSALSLISLRHNDGVHLPEIDRSNFSKNLGELGGSSKVAKGVTIILVFGFVLRHESILLES